MSLHDKSKRPELWLGKRMKHWTSSCSSRLVHRVHVKNWIHGSKLHYIAVVLVWHKAAILFVNHLVIYLLVVSIFLFSVCLLNLWRFGNVQVSAGHLNFLKDWRIADNQCPKEKAAKHCLPVVQVLIALHYATWATQLSLCVQLNCHCVQSVIQPREWRQSHESWSTQWTSTQFECTGDVQVDSNFSVLPITCLLLVSSYALLWMTQRSSQHWTLSLFPLLCHQIPLTLRDYPSPLRLFFLKSF